MERKVGRPISITIKCGERYGRLIVIKELDDHTKNSRRILCRCDCGNEITVSPSQIKSGKTKSCGCYRIENATQRATKHGLSSHPLYPIWKDMLRRCNNPRRKWFKNYGGRGISVCAEWTDFKNFYNWSIQNGYMAGLTIERKNNDGDYCPENCKWATYKEQANNKTNSVLVEYDGERRTLSQWSKILGIKRETLGIRLKRWTTERAFSEPVNTKFGPHR